MKTIAAFIFNLSKGGAQGVFVNIINFLFENGFNIEVIVQNLKDDIYSEDLNKNIKVINLNVNSAKKLTPKLSEYVNSHDFDCAMAFSPEIAVNLVWIRMLLKKKYVIVGRCINTLSVEYNYTKSFFRRYITNNIIRIFYHKIDYLIAQSEGMANDLINNYMFKKDQIIVINNAMAPLFEHEAVSNTCLERENIILYVGRLEEQKGLTMLLDAFSAVLDKNIKLYIVGSGSQKNKLYNYVNYLGLSSRVEFIEHTKQILEYYKKVKLTVLCSYYEGFPNVLVESIACGTPVVSFDLPSGPSEIIIDGINGLLVNYLNVTELSKKIDWALQKQWDSSIIKDTSLRYHSDRILFSYYSFINEILQ